MDGGNLAEWVGVLASTGVYLDTRRRTRGAEFLKVLTENAEQSADMMMEVMEAQDIFSEIVERGLEAAARSGSEKKRRLLGRVVAGAFSGDGLASPEIYRLLVRTVDAVEVEHVQMLVLLATPTPGHGELAGTAVEGFSTKGDISGRWPDVGASESPILAALVKEGLVDGQNVASGQMAYSPTSYGRKLLDFVSVDDLGGAILGAAALVARVDTRVDPCIVVRNIGPGSALEIGVTANSNQGENSLRNGPHEYVDALGPFAEASLLIQIPTFANSGPYEVGLTWRDVRGTKAHRAEVDQNRA